jgi:molecular chaperone DnaK (HSP70)
VSKLKSVFLPLQAALAYGVDQATDGEELVIVFDLGRDTYDVSMLLVSQGLTEIVCTGGDDQLGGSNSDARVAQYLQRMTKVSSKNSKSSDVMIHAAEQARIYLSNNRQVNLALPLTK